MESAVEIASTLLDALLTEAAGSPEREICGLLFGSTQRIDAAQACRNVADDPEVAFEIDPAALIAAYRAMRGGGPMVIGHYHSHPNQDSTPSPRDAAAAAEEGTLWLIIGNSTARLWRVVEGGPWLDRFEPVALHVAAPCAGSSASP